MDSFIKLKSVSFTYHLDDQLSLKAVDQVSLSIARGSHVAVLGRNGSGKSTLARLINALEQPQEGRVFVSGMLTEEEEHIWEIRRLCGMVFQNPDNQIIGTTVEEDVAFGPENLGFPQAEIRRAVDDALAYVGLTEMAQKPPHLLSGGQKQKLAIAGILAMRPACLILDEATSMLDPVSCREFMQLIQRLIREENLTVINITHNMEEALLADQVHVMSEGKIVLSGTPAEVFDQVDMIKSLGLDVPVHADIVYQLAKHLQTPLLPLETASWEKAQQAVRRLLALEQKPQPEQAESNQEQASPAERKSEHTAAETVITVENLSYTYTANTPFATPALDQVSFDVRRGELLGIIGHSGSGKSTLIQHLNGLLRTQQGRVQVLSLNASSNHDIRKIRQHVGLVFQYPEHQLFEESVFQDIAFGPRRLGLDVNQVEKRVLKAARVVGLSEDILERSPFELSGGQKRRVAIAGVIAMEPDVLILDEPAAGLDPAGREEILGYAARLKAMNVTVVLVSHSMEDIARLADRILVLRDGKAQSFGLTAEVFADEQALVQAGLSLPRTVAFLQTLQQDLPGLDTNQFTAEAAARQLLTAAGVQAAMSAGEAGDRCAD